MRSLPALGSLLMLALLSPAADTRPDLPLDDVPMPEYQFRFVDFSPCADCENINTIKDVQLKRTGKTTVAIFGMFVIGIAIGVLDNWKAKVLIYRQEGDDAQSRMQVAELKIDDMCEKMKGENYQRLLNYIEGDMSKECPLTTGTFKLVAYEVQMESFKGKLQPGDWFIQVIEYANDTQITCYDIEIEVSL